MPSGSPPVVLADTYFLLTQGQIQISAPGVLANDTDAEGDSLSAQLQMPPTHGNTDLTADGSFRYTPVQGFVGTDSFTYCASDGTGYSDPATVTVNVQLSANFAQPNQALEGTPFTGIIATFTSANANLAASDFSASIDWSDGNTGTGTITALGGGNFSVSGSHTYADDGQFPAQVTITDNAGNSVVATNLIMVANLAPTAQAGSNQTVHETDVVNLHGTFTDPGVLDTHTFLWHVASSNGQIIANGTTQDFSFTPNHSGTYMVSFMVTDNAGAFSLANTTVSVLHVPPTLSLNGPDQIDAGANYALALSSYETGTDTIQGWTINWGDGTIAQFVVGNPNAVTHVFAYHAPGQFTISATATDMEGTYAAGNSQLVTVNNLPPVIDLAVAYGIQRFVTLSGHVNDANPGGLTITFSGMVTGTATTDANGNYTLTASATGLGTVSASTVDGCGLTSNTATVTLTSQAPVIDQFQAIYQRLNVWALVGHVTDESAVGLTVHFGGLPSLTNVQRTATVQSDGTFIFYFILFNPNESGTATAVVTDWWNLVSNTATAPVNT